MIDQTKTWKKAAKTENAVSGFEAMELVPFNPNHLNYMKLLGTAATLRVNTDERNGLIKVGNMQCLSIVEGTLTSSELELFKKRYDKIYPIEKAWGRKSFDS